MPRKRQSDKIVLHIKGQPSPEDLAKAFPVEIGLSLPCFKEIRKHLGITFRVVDGKLMRFSSSAVNELEEESDDAN